MQGPPGELASFCAREHPRLVGALTLYCGDRAVAEEIAQDAIERACERWETVGRMDAPGAWVHRVAVNAATSRFRRRAAELRARRRIEREHVGVHEPPDTATAVAVRRAVADLPTRQAQVLVLRYYLGWSVAEAAEWLGVSDGAVKMLSQRAIQRLRDDLDVTGVPTGQIGTEQPRQDGEVHDDTA